MGAVFFIKQGDTAEAIQADLVDADLTAILGVRFVMKRELSDADPLIDQPAEVVHATGPATVKYQWQAGDTDEVGEFLAEFRVTFPDSTVGRYPNDSHIRVLVQTSL
jgi:hypothetical protein